MSVDIQTKVFEEKAIIYAEEFLNGFNETISQYYGNEANEIIEKGYPWLYLTLYRKELGKDLSVSAFCGVKDFYLFFTKPVQGKIRKLLNEYFNPEFGEEWSSKTPEQIKLEKVLQLHGLDKSLTIDEPVHIGGLSFITSDKSEIRRNAENHGRSRADLYGQTTVQYLPQLREMVKSTSKKLSFRRQYELLKKNLDLDGRTKLSSQQIGHKFEKLWRDLLNFYGWQARKIILKGEGNDFTAIFEGHHILGETRWEKKPLNGEAVNAFAGKLAPRPQTIGFIISRSGFDEGAYGVVRRLVASGRTVVFFDKVQIEKVIISLSDPGEIFSLELRNVYDFLFEKPKKKS